ncbi:Calmodulin-regulated spectrin-associated protein 1 [Geranomyces variabilis]|uniref:Calmodulin-regulated spectrin-associated protein 1 n=1 Tax=Geranomyces variabilis TaxID=109894 RepID=A0AAD5TKZ1_9FUNG|nr:Calmodulin-regulated spectrin-associated protein 1 [Geranomyces variabilis]
MQWVQDHLGFEALSYNDISEGFVLLQILSLISASATDLSWYSSSAAFKCDDISARIYTDVAKGLREVGISADDVSDQVIAGARSGDAVACDALLSALRARYEALHGPPAVAAAAAASVVPPAQDASDSLSLHNDYDSEWYEAAEPAVRWTLLCAKRQNDISSESSKKIDEVLWDLDRQNGKLIPRAKLIPYLCSGRLYEAAASLIFGETSPEYLDHLTTHGYLKFKSSLRDSIRDMIADDTPFYEVKTRRFPTFNIAALYPYDLEDALMIWSNQCLAQLRKEAPNALPTPSPLAQALRDTPDVDEPGPGFSDGRVFCLIMCLYLPNACARHMRHLLTPESRLANWTAFTSVCHDQPGIDVTWSADELASAEHASPGSSTGAVRLIYMSIVCQLFCAFQSENGPDALAAIKMLELSLTTTTRRRSKKSVKAELAIRNSGNQFLQKTSSRTESKVTSKEVVNEASDELQQAGSAVVVAAISHKKTLGGKSLERKAKETSQTHDSKAEPAASHSDGLPKETSSNHRRMLVKSAAPHGDESTEKTLSTDDKNVKAASDQSKELSNEIARTRILKAEPAAPELSKGTSRTHTPQAAPATKLSDEVLKETPRTRTPQAAPATQRSSEVLNAAPRTHIAKAQTSTLQRNELPKETQSNNKRKVKSSAHHSDELAKETPQTRLSSARSASPSSDEQLKETPRTRVSKATSAVEQNGELSEKASNPDSRKEKPVTAHNVELPADTPATRFSNEESAAHHSGGLSKETQSVDKQKLKSASHQRDKPSKEILSVESWQTDEAAVHHSNGLTIKIPRQELGNMQPAAHHGDPLPEKMSHTQSWRESSATYQRAESSKKTPDREFESAESPAGHSDADDAGSDFGLSDMPILFSHRASSASEAPAMPMMSVFPEIVTSSLGSSRKLHGVSTRDLPSTAHAAPASLQLTGIATVPPPVAVPDANSQIPTPDRIWSATKRSRPVSAKSLKSTSVWVAAPPAQVNVNSAGIRVADPFSDEEGWSTEEDPDDVQDVEEADSVTDAAEWETDEEAQVQDDAKEMTPVQAAPKVVKEAPALARVETVTRPPIPHRRSTRTRQSSVSRLSSSPPVASTPPTATQKQEAAPSVSTTRPTSAVQIAPAAEPSRQQNASHSAGSRTRHPATGLRQYPLEESDSEDCGAEEDAIHDKPLRGSPILPAALRQGPPADADSTDTSDDEVYAIRKPVEVARASHLALSDQMGTVVSSIRVVDPHNEVMGTSVAPAVANPSANPSVSELKDLKQVQKPAERLQEIKTRKAETIRRMEAAREQELQRIALQKQEDAKKKDEAKRIRLREQGQKLEERAKQIADERAKLKKDQERAASSPTSTAGAATSRRPSKSSVRANVKEQSNRQLIRNALVHVCLAGSVNEKCQEEVLEDLETTSSNHFIILFHAPSTQTFRGLYSYDPRLDQALKIHPGTQGPDVLDTANVLTFYKYDSGARIFKPVPTKSFGRSVHAVAIGREWATKGKEKAAAKFKTKEPVKSAVTC